MGFSLEDSGDMNRFYQLKNDIGQGCCMEMCDGQFNSLDSCRPQFVGKFLIFARKSML